MTVTEGLVELKLLTKRIAIATSNLSAITYKSAGKLVSAEKDEAKFKTLAESGLQSVKALIERRGKIKEAIVQSNASTQVVIGGVTMTVASAIERKDSIEYEKTLLNHLVNQYNNATKSVESLTQQVQREVDEQIKQMGAVSPELVAETRTKLLEQRQLQLHDPLGLLTKIEELRKDIDEFEAGVDTALSISNATTQLTLS